MNAGSDSFAIYRAAKKTLLSDAFYRKIDITDYGASWLMNFGLRWTSNRHFDVSRNLYNNGFYIQTTERASPRESCLFRSKIHSRGVSRRLSGRGDGVIALVGQAIMIIMLITYCELSSIDARRRIVEIELRKFRPSFKTLPKASY